MKPARHRVHPCSIFSAVVLVAGLTLPAAAPAQEGPGTWEPQVWLNAGSFSRHFERDRDFREDNIGFGAEAWLARDHGVLAGSFINSDRARSHYAAYQWRPLHWAPAGIQVSAGVAVGVFDGYPRYRDGGWFPAALPVLGIEYRRVGVNLFLVPTISDRVDGALAVQFKLRVW